MRAIIEDWHADVTGSGQRGGHSWWPWALAALDFDNDGDVDLLATQHGPNGTRVMRNEFHETGRVHFENANPDLGLPSLGALGSTFKPAIFDANGDGFLDLCFSDSRPSSCFFNRAGRAFAAMAWRFSQTDKLEAVDDFDGDGYLDLETFNARFLYKGGRQSFVREARDREALRGLPAATLVALRGSPTTPGHFPRRTFCFDGVDLNGDGREDLACSGFGSYGGVAVGRYLLTDEDGVLTDQTSALRLPLEGAPILVMDLNSDGVDDVLTAAAEDAGVYLSTQRGFLRVGGPLTVRLQRHGAYLQRASPVDLDEDGDVDLVLSLPRDRTAVIFENLGKGAFRDVLTLPGWDSDPIAVADFNGDRLRDVAVGGPGDTVTLVLNQTRKPGHGLELRLHGAQPNPFAVGAVVEVFKAGDLAKDQRALFRDKARPDGLSLHFGLGSLASVDLRVSFPAEGLQASRIVELRGLTVDRSVMVSPTGEARPTR